MSRPINDGRFKKGHLGLVGKANPMWRGDKVGYTALHEWLYRGLGQPKRCTNCGTATAKKYEWASISKKYQRVKDDWKRLCVSCHRVYDGHGYKCWVTRRKAHA